MISSNGIVAQKIYHNFVDPILVTKKNRSSPRPGGFDWFVGSINIKSGGMKSGTRQEITVGSNVPDESRMEINAILIPNEAFVPLQILPLELIEMFN